MRVRSIVTIGLALGIITLAVGVPRAEAGPDPLAVELMLNEGHGGDPLDPGSRWAESRGAPVRGDGTGQTVFVLYAAVLALFAASYQGSREHESRVRLCAAAALSASVILLATSGMPWLRDVVAGAECRLGGELACTAPPAALLERPDAGLLLFELERWRAGADAIRLGQLMTFALLLPGLIWLLVEPRARPAQATAAVGATLAAFTLLAAVFYRTTMPDWVVLEVYTTYDLTLLAASVVVLAVIGIIRNSVALDGEAPPRAVLRRG
jgi:hypothetical protein